MKPTLLASAALALCLSADAAAAEPKREPRLDPALRWYGDNRARLDALIGQYGVGSPGYDAAHKPVAAFDWDNTVVRNDVGDATLFWMIKNGKLRQPPRRNWRFVPAPEVEEIIRKDAG